VITPQEIVYRGADYGGKGRFVVKSRVDPSFLYLLEPQRMAVAKTAFVNLVLAVDRSYFGGSKEAIIGVIHFERVPALVNQV
jgi:hypothetical protein